MDRSPLPMLFLDGSDLWSPDGGSLASIKAAVFVVAVSQPEGNTRPSSSSLLLNAASSSTSLNLMVNKTQDEIFPSRCTRTIRCHPGSQQALMFWEGKHDDGHGGHRLHGRFHQLHVGRRAQSGSVV